MEHYIKVVISSYFRHNPIYESSFLGLIDTNHCPPKSVRKFIFLGTKLTKFIFEGIFARSFSVLLVYDQNFYGGGGEGW